MYTMKKILLVVGILVLAVPAIASVGVKESTSIPYLDNYGYSDSMNNYVQMHKANKNGQAYYPNSKFRPELKYYGHNNVWNSIVTGTRAVWHYMDPAEDEQIFGQKDIKFYSNSRDAH